MLVIVGFRDGPESVKLLLRKAMVRKGGDLTSVDGTSELHTTDERIRNSQDKISA